MYMCRVILNTATSKQTKPQRLKSNCQATPACRRPDPVCCREPALAPFQTTTTTNASDEHKLNKTNSGEKASNLLLT